jgi:hypothetical protein
VTHPYWPLFDLRLSTLDLELRPMTEADQVAVSDLLPDDVELDPAAATSRSTITLVVASWSTKPIGGPTAHGGPSRGA